MCSTAISDLVGYGEMAPQGGARSQEKTRIGGPFFRRIRNRRNGCTKGESVTSLTAAPADPLSALTRNRIESPEDPWLFYPAGGQWRWLSWRHCCYQVAQGAARLSEMEPAARVAFAYTPGPDGVAADLALQAAGLVSVPLDPSRSEDVLRARLAERGCAAILDIEAGIELPRRSDVPLPRLWLPSWEAAIPAGVEDAELGAAPATAGVLVAAEPTCFPVPMSDLVARAQDLDRRLKRSAIREVWVSYGSLESLEERLLLTWSLLVGSAVVLEPRRPELMRTILWARPTLLEGDLGLLAELRSTLWWLAGRTASRRRLRRHLGRLRHFIVRDDRALTEGEETFWEDLGVRLLWWSTDVTALS